MARKSRKETAAVAVQEADAACRAAIYVRLSVEDTHTHSVSIETQQMIIARYLEQYPEISVYDTYIDNGATGTNFHRPGFQQMLSDIEAGHVNCVIVKDLSRLGRNTIDTGYYIEQYFRIRSIRFIAVNENFDTANPEDAHSGIIIPLRNMINEADALDIGRKIRAQQRQAMKDGKFIGARTPYGYLKAEDDCHQLVIDPVAAVVVQRMFRWASEGAGLNTMAILNFSDVLKNVGLDPKRVKLIRHSLGDKAFKKCYDKGMVEEYTRVQSETFSNGYDYWCVFISDKSTTAKFFACYKVSGGVIDTQDTKPKGFPLEDWFQGQRMFYNLERIDLLKEYEGRLLIEWGKSALAWAQKGTNEKPIVAIRDKKIFSGYENAILTYEELREIVQDPTAYESWHTALSTVNAVYLIVDRENGRKYVGSAYGKGGLLGRWTHYVKSLHGDNKLMKELLCDYPDRYTHFQFSILQLLPKAVTPDEVIQTETLWKKKLLTYEPLGMNAN